MYSLNFKISFITLIFLLAGCANTLEFTKSTSKDNFLFNPDETLNVNINDVDKISKMFGRDKTGYIPPDESKEREDFLKKYPASLPDDKSYDALSGRTFNHKVGQVLRLSADLDNRTSGIIKDDKGQAVSISGMMVIDSSPVLSGAISGAGSQAIASSVSSKSLINPTQSAGANIGTGLVAGLLVGFISEMQADAAIKGIISKNNFGQRMEETTFTISMPSATKIDHFGISSNKSHIKISPSLVKSIYTITGTKNIQFKNQIFFISTVAVYRGEKYKSDYPATEGWEFIITNINSIYMNQDSSIEEQFKKIKTELNLKEITL